MDSTFLFRQSDQAVLRDITAKAEVLDIPVAGRDSKVWIKLDGKRFLLKTNPNVAITEHVGSRFFNELGVSAQHTELVIFRGELACLISDIIEDKVFRTFKCVFDSSIKSGSDERSYTIDDIEYILDRYCNADWIFVQNLEYWFFKVLVVDALIANGDRHSGNWGYLCKSDQRYQCDVFDNGASLFPEMIDFRNISEKQWHTLVVDLPKSQVRAIPDRKCTFYQLFRECRDKIGTSWISIDAVIQAIEKATQGLDKDRAEFYKKLVWLRYKCIIEGCEFNEAFRLYRS